MKNLTYEEILEQLNRIANGDAYNDLENLPSTLRWLASEADSIKTMKLSIKK